MVKNKSILDKRYGGLNDTMDVFYRAGIITEEEFNSVMLDLVLCEAEEMLRKYNQ